MTIAGVVRMTLTTKTEHLDRTGVVIRVISLSRHVHLPKPTNLIRWLNVK